MMFKSKFMWLGLVLALLGGAQGFDFATIVADPILAGKITGVLGVVIMVLRAMTTVPLSEK